jgi:hypothetical protein
MIEEKSVSKPKSAQNQAEICYEHASCFLNEEERTEAFKILLSLLDSKPESALTPERQVAKIIKVSDMAVSKWKNKLTAPSSQTSAKILFEIMKRDPNRINPRIAALSNKLMEEVFNTYILLLDKNAFDRNQNYRYIRSSLSDLTQEYVSYIAILLLFDKGLAVVPSFPNYSSYSYNPEWKRRNMQDYLRGLHQSIDALKKLVDRAQIIYNSYMNQT